MRKLLLALVCGVGMIASAQAQPGLPSGPPACQTVINQMLDYKPYGIDPINGGPISGIMFRDIYRQQVPLISAMLAMQLATRYPDLSATEACQAISAKRIPMLPIGVF